MNFFLEITKDQFQTVTINGDNFADMLAFGAKMLLIGVGTVFSVLALIWGALVLFRIFFHDLPAKHAEKRSVHAFAENTADVPGSEQTDEGELIAVLTAAVVAAESDAPGKKFRVVSFRRT